MISPEKCPYCFRQLGTWVKDPIFLPNGGPYVWTSDTEIIKEDRIDHRFYKGFYQICEPEVQEIQDFLKAAEVTAGVTITTWSPLNMSGKFQILGKHIKEMRDSVEKLLTNFGLTKTDYFNYDEEGNEITQPNGQKLEWTDPITNATDLKKFQVKYIHIEDLRHYIQTIYFRENWESSTPITVPYGSSAHFIGQDYKYWNLPSWDNSCDVGSYFQITSVKDAFFHIVPGTTHSSIPAVSFYYNGINQSYKIYPTTKFEFNLKLINLPITAIHFPPVWGPLMSWDCFRIQLAFGSQEGPIYYPILTYYWNYDPTYFTLFTDTNGVYKGNLSAGILSYNLYDDLITLHPDVLKYYNGTYSTKGMWLSTYLMAFGITQTGAVHELVIDDIKIK